MKRTLLKAPEFDNLIRTCFPPQNELHLAVDCLRTKNATEMVNKEWDGIVFGMMGCPFVPVLDGKVFPGEEKGRNG